LTRSNVTSHADVSVCGNAKRHLASHTVVIMPFPGL